MPADGELTGSTRGRPRLSSSQEGLIAGVVVALAVVVYGAFGPVVPIGKGFGWDGVLYGTLAKNFFGALEEPGLPADRVSRVLPSFLVWAGLGLARIERSGPVVRAAFVAMNALLTFGAISIFNATLDRMKLSRTARWLGLIGLSVSFMGLVMPAYYAPLTDSFGLFASCLALYGFIAHRTAWSTGASAIGAVSWPTTSYVAAFCSTFAPIEGSRWASPAVADRWSQRAGVAAFIGVVLAGGVAAWLGHTPTMSYRDATPRLEATLPLSILIAALYISIGTRTLLKAALDGPRPRVTLLRLLGPALVYVVLTLAVSTLAARGGKSILGMMFFGADSIFGRSAVAPGVFLVAHVTYFGPIVLLGLLLRRALAQVAAELGLGVILTALVGLLLSLTSESRHLIAFWPLFVLLVAASLPEDLDRRPVVAFFALSLLWSKVWLIPHTIGSDGRPTLTRYFAHQGPWMIREAYVIQLAAALLTLALLWRAHPRRTAPRTTTEA